MNLFRATARLSPALSRREGRAPDPNQLSAATLFVAAEVAPLAATPIRSPKPRQSAASVRPVRVEGCVAFVTLTKGYEAIIDAADAAEIGQWNWSAHVKHSGKVYAVRKARDVATGNCFQVKMHRVLADVPSDLQVDHRNGDGLDNRSANLRWATIAENNRNKRPTNLGRKGFYWEVRDRRWVVRICVQGRQVAIARCKTPKEAQAAYNAASIKYHGEFGRTI